VVCSCSCLQARGPKKHLKRLNAPKHWMLSKMDGIWVRFDAYTLVRNLLMLPTCSYF
jgi:hypothetical protein